MRTLIFVACLLHFGAVLADAQRPDSQPPEAVERRAAVGPPHLILRRLGKVYTNGIGMRLAWCPPGQFEMGSPDEEPERYFSEMQRSVKLTQGFYLGVYEVTVAQFKQFVDETDYKTVAERDAAGGHGYNAEEGRFYRRSPQYSWRNTGWRMTNDRPVVNVTWTDAMAYCAWLSKKEGQTYRLPTEAEWEYACRAGTTTSYFPGEDIRDLEGYANLRDELLERTPGTNLNVRFHPFYDGFAFAAPVGSYKPNPWGFYDMHGNVWEWCLDTYRVDPWLLPETDPLNADPDTRKVFRGGSWSSSIGESRSARRAENFTGTRSGDLGFRVAFCPEQGGAANSLAQQFAAPKPREQQEPPPGQDRNAGDILTNSIGMKLAWCPPGTFEMGSPEDEEGRVADVEKQHRVTLSRGFYMGIYPVTVGQFRQFNSEFRYRTAAETRGHGQGINLADGKVDRSPNKYNWMNPGFEQTDDHPVVNIALKDAEAFCKWLSKREGKTYRLPTEAEWEYACRAGTTTTFSSGNDVADLEGYANLADQSAKRIPGYPQDFPVVPFDDGFQFTSPVGALKPNPWGLYDMHGNVAQWCQDWYLVDYENYAAIDPIGDIPAPYRVVRGGAWEFAVTGCRSASRNYTNQNIVTFSLGFRVATTQ